MKRALVIEDSEPVRAFTRSSAIDCGVQTDAVGSVSDAIEALSSNGSYHVIFLDVGLTDGSGFEVLEHLTRENLAPAVIFMTADTSSETMLRALRWGAVDFIPKPATKENIRAALDRAGALTRSGESSLEVEEWRMRACPDFVGSDPTVVAALETARRVASSDCAVLVHGETGTGKELFARAIHAGSFRAAAPLVTINCAAIPENLIESELFGFAKGAFTGASQRRDGAFQAADGGTLFLDEIGEMTLPVQAKVLRALQEHEVQPIGSNRTVRVDVRVVAATHRNLEQMVADRLFREDLFYRLDVIRVLVPALRERPADISRLVFDVLDRLNVKRERPITGVAPAAMRALESYSWPGNVRQLQNVIERAAILRGSGVIQLEDIPDRVRGTAPSTESILPEPKLPEGGLQLRDAVDRFESALILQALSRAHGNRNRAANILGMNRTTLVEKLKKQPDRPGVRKVRENDTSSFDSECLPLPFGIG